MAKIIFVSLRHPDDNSIITSQSFLREIYRPAGKSELSTINCGLKVDCAGRCCHTSTCHYHREVAVLAHENDKLICGN